MLVHSFVFTNKERKGLAYAIIQFCHTYLCAWSNIKIQPSGHQRHRMPVTKWECSQPHFCDFQTLVLNKYRSNIDLKTAQLFLFFNFIPIIRACDVSSLMVPLKAMVCVHLVPLSVKIKNSKCSVNSHSKLKQIILPPVTSTKCQAIVHNQNWHELIAHLQLSQCGIRVKCSMWACSDAKFHPLSKRPCKESGNFSDDLLKTKHLSHTCLLKSKSKSILHMILPTHKVWTQFFQFKFSISLWLRFEQQINIIVKIGQGKVYTRFTFKKPKLCPVHSPEFLH